MAKVTLPTIGSLNPSAVTTINQNFQRVAQALENTVSRDGTSPNQITVDLDLNHNDLLNVGEVYADFFNVREVKIEGIEWSEILATILDVKESSEAFAVQAGAFAVEAGGFQDSAQTFRNQASGFSTSASGFADASLAAKNLSQLWASAPEDVDVGGGFGSALHYSRKAAKSATEAATFNPVQFVRRDGTQGMTSGVFRTSPSTAGNASLIIPAGTATPSGAALVDGAIWGDGTNIIWRLGGSTRTALDTVSLPLAPAAELDAGVATEPRRFSVANIIRAVAARFLRFDTAQSLTAAQQNQARLNLDAASRRQVVASFTGDGSTLFYLTPEMIIDNPTLQYVISSGSVGISARIGTSTGYTNGATSYLIHTTLTTADNTMATFKQSRSTLILGSDAVAGTLVVSPLGVRTRAEGINPTSGNRQEILGSTATTGDRLVILNSDGNPLPSGVGIIFYGSKR